MLRPTSQARAGPYGLHGIRLKPAAVELLQTSQKLASGEQTGNGLGWYLKSVTLAGKRA
jgi:hypothetical protein